jgi:hypothetical protein
MNNDRSGDESQFRSAIIEKQVLKNATVASTIGGTRLSGPFPEGPACRVRRITFDNPFWFCGRDRHAPPIFPSGGRACRVRFSEGPACRVRCATLDYPSRFGGD